MPKHMASQTTPDTSKEQTSFFSNSGPYVPKASSANNLGVQEEVTARVATSSQDSRMERIRRAPAPQNIIESPSQQPFEAPSGNAYSDVSGPRTFEGKQSGARGWAALLTLLAWLCRICAVIYAVLVVGNVFVTGQYRIYLINLSAHMTEALPEVLAGRFVVETPLGGALRGDFVIASVILFVVDWLLIRFAAKMRRR